ncbi:MAG: hypothetical protein ACJASX_002899 [Limisphaerales bacterium]|jgi:hypothetical protein
MAISCFFDIPSVGLGGGAGETPGALSTTGVSQCGQKASEPTSSGPNLIFFPQFGQGIRCKVSPDIVQLRKPKRIPEIANLNSRVAAKLSLKCSREREAVFSGQISNSDFPGEGFRIFIRIHF